MGVTYFLNKLEALWPVFACTPGCKQRPATATKYGEDTVRQAAAICEDTLNTGDLFKGGYNICV